MTVRTILVSIDGTQTSGATLDAAFRVARTFGVHVDVLHIRPDILTQVPAIGDGMTAGLVDTITSRAQDHATTRANQAKRIFDETCTRLDIDVVTGDQFAAGISASWLERTGTKQDHLPRLGRVHDLIVLGHPTAPKDMEHSATVQALFGSGRPVLTVPQSTPKTIGRKIAIAWNGSAECARALGGASNFFAHAETVTILTAQSERTPVSVVAELQHYLARHQVKVETKILADLGEKFLRGQTLLDECKKINADLLVMGAYKLSGLRQLVLGNATSDILTSASIPVLMGH